MNVLVTGSAGFIGMHVCKALLVRGDRVWGLDLLRDNPEPALQAARLAELVDRPGFTFVRGDIRDQPLLMQLLEAHGIQHVIHLAARAGVRDSIQHPRAFAEANLMGFLSILETCRHAGVRHLVYASSSSVYGTNQRLPYSESDPVDHPVSFYAATKKANELMAHAYSDLHGMPTTGLRFFTVYGPWGRPDMSPMKFAKAILDGRPIDVYNHGQMRRDFTFVGDVVHCVLEVLVRPPYAAAPSAGGGGTPRPPAPWRVLNVGNRHPVPLLEYVGLLEQALGKKADVRLLPLQPGDVLETCADTAALAACIGFVPDTPLREGLAQFAAWLQQDYPDAVGVPPWP